VKTADIVKWNDLNSTQYLKAGQQLKLYVDVTKFSA
ncbi:LysM peptidoglycan-binding domain-containing protein, partial [Vibrio cholerae]